MIYALLLLAIIALVFGPTLWVRAVLHRYSRPVDRYAGTGGELARHLLKQLGMDSVTVEQTEAGDHYDPRDKAVRLSADNFNGRSLTAVTVAAHEVGHAVQDAFGYAPLRWRTRLIQLTKPLEKVGAGVLMLSPVAAALTRAPSVTVLMLVGGLLSLGAAALVHLITLPTELDASFSRALPLLQKGDYLHPGDLPHARKLLTAAALTYVAASLMSLLNVGRWWAILRR